MELVLAGGVPEALRRGSERRRQDWGRAYLESVLTRDLQDIAEIERLSELPRFVRVLAAHAAQLANYSRFGSGIGVSYKTAQRYVGLLEKLFLVSSLEPWYTNRLKRLVKSPKLHFLDSGLLSSIRQFTMDRARLHREEFGIALETFVHAELLKLVSGSGLRVTPFHFRDQRGNEVDVVLERADGAVIGVEVKASATVSPSDLSRLRKLAEVAGSRFVFGALLYDGETPVPFGARLAAVPISCLWNGSAS
jgi:uncharacterized protein